MTKAYFDPGGPCAGVAVFFRGKLVDCALSRTKSKDLGQRAADHRKFVCERLYPHRFAGEPIVIRSEMMWHRPRKSKKGDYIPPQDLIHTNLIAGHVGTEWIYPHDWKGMVPKATHQPKILACLEPEELALVEAVMPPSLRHNVIDAIGIGLHDVGRLAMQSESEECLRVKQLIERMKKLSGRRGSRGTTSAREKKQRGKKRPARPSFITMPKGTLTAPRTGPATRSAA